MKKLLSVILLIPFMICVRSPAQGSAEFSRQECMVITGKPLAPLVGIAPEKLSLFAKTPKGFEPVPFQIDKRYRKGKRIAYYYTGGRLAKEPKDPGLAALDELVFWSGDAGPRVAADEWKGSKRGIEIEITDPVSGAKAYVYLLAFEGKAPRSERWYVRYDPDQDKIEALYYNLDYGEKYKIGFKSLAIKKDAGGSGENFVEEMNYRINVRAGGHIIPYELDEKQFHTKVMGWIEGPVRARRKTLNYIELFVWLGSTSCAESVYTPSGFSIEAPVVGGLPVKWLTNLSTRWALELNQKGIGMTFRSDRNPQGLVIGGKMNEAQRKLDYSPPQWLLISGGPGALLRRPGKKSDRPLYVDLYYMDDEKVMEEGDETPGQIGAAGYYVPYAGRRGWKMHENIVDYFEVLPNYKEGDVAKFLEKAAKPLVITSREATAQNPAPGPAASPTPKRERKDNPQATYTYVGEEAPPIESQVLPIYVASSDNGLGAGLMYVHANPFDTHIRFMVQSWYTIKSYSLTEFLIGEERPREGSDWSWWSHAKYHLRPGRDFYGLGNDSIHEDRTNFYDEIFSWEWRANRRVLGPLWLGAFAEMHREFVGPGKGNWSPDTFEPDHFPDLFGKGAFWTNRIGATIFIDTRNNYYVPTAGGYYKIEYYSVPKWLGNDFDFEYWYLDLRRFIAVRGPRKDILALRLQAKHAEGGPIPFYEMSIDGSEYTLRGFYDGRFRDRDMSSLNIEWRHNLWKIVDLNLFYDLGRVYDDITKNTDFITNDLHRAWGVGFRIIIPPNVVMRADAGWSNTDQVLYFNFGQTF